MIPTPNIPLVDDRARGTAWDQCALFPGEYHT